MLAAADPTAVAALRVAIAALVISIIGTGLAWWSARSSARSARISRDALDLERERRHEELAPQITLSESDHRDEQEGVWLSNDGTVDYTAVYFTVASTTQPSPIQGFLVDSEWTTEGDLGPIESGDRRFLPYQRTEEDPGGTVRLRIICSNRRGGWSLMREFEILPPPFVGVVWH
jgi:hypothetical protein